MHWKFQKKVIKTIQINSLITNWNNFALLNITVYNNIPISSILLGIYCIYAHNIYIYIYSYAKIILFMQILKLQKLKYLPKISTT